jgi:hypothetical protein
MRLMVAAGLEAVRAARHRQEEAFVRMTGSVQNRATLDHFLG